jgi:mRNA-degrading endonuclease RelE of RelBE toxin-antitoxin system
MQLLETPKFQKLRKKLREEDERALLREEVLLILKNPESGKKLKGEFRDLHSLRYSVQGQARRLIYRYDKDSVVLFSFGPRQRIYK